MAAYSPFARRIALDRAPSPPEMLAALPPGPGRCLLETSLAPPPPPGQAEVAPATAYSLAAAEPDAVLIAWGRRVELHGSGKSRYLEADPLPVLESQLARRRTDFDPALPVTGAAIGYVGYDLIQLWERISPAKGPALPMPDLYVAFYDLLAVFNHDTNELWLTGTRPAAAGPGADFLEKVGRWQRALRKASRAAAPADADQAPPTHPPVSVLTSSLSPPAYRAIINQALQYIAAGDIFEVNLAQRWTGPVPPAWGPVPGWPVYQRLRLTTPSPFAAYLEGPGFQVASASPERFLQVRIVDGQRQIETRPIKGTRPRGKDPAADHVLATELLQSAKDRAELVMAVDVARNDLGRVCEFGAVRVPDLVRLETFPSLHHTVATVTGRLRSDAGVADILRATFPPASVTGAPKVRAMEIIADLEPVARGLYTGAIGYFSYDGRLDLNVAIRTLCLAAGQAHFHCGGGIVADSDPEAEWRESLTKGQSLAAALGVDLERELLA